ncbi:unnamed protein product, partial [Prorocentrum cordatum]
VHSGRHLRLTARLPGDCPSERGEGEEDLAAYSSLHKCKVGASAVASNCDCTNAFASTERKPPLASVFATSWEEDLPFAIGATNCAQMSMGCAGDWVHALTAQGAQMRFARRRGNSRGGAEMQTVRDAMNPAAERERDLSLNAFMDYTANIRAAASMGPPSQTQASRFAEQTNPPRSAWSASWPGEDGAPIQPELTIWFLSEVQGATGGEYLAALLICRSVGYDGIQGTLAVRWAISGTSKLGHLCGARQPLAAEDYEEPDLRGRISGLRRLALRSAAEMREMNHMATDFYLVPVSNWAFRKSMTADHCCWNLVRERGKGHLLTPPGAHAGLAFIEGTQVAVTEWQEDDATSVTASMGWAMDTLNDFLTMADGNNAYGQAAVAGAIRLRRVSESYEARDSKNGGPNEDEQQFWEGGHGQYSDLINEGRDLKQAVGVLIAFVGGKGSQSAAPKMELGGTGNIQICINEAPNFRAALPKDTDEGTMAKLDKFPTRDLKQAVGVLIALVGGKESQSAAPEMELEWAV